MGRPHLCKYDPNLMHVYCFLKKKYMDIKTNGCDSSTIDSPLNGERVITINMKRKKLV